MADLEKDGYAFPGPRFSQSGVSVGQGQGMTMRDWFAAQAMIGIMSTAGGFDRADRRHSMVARNAYEFADAMLAEREK